LSRSLTVTGTVRDAITAQPISRFRMTCGYPSQRNARAIPTINWSYLDRFSHDFNDSKFEQTFEEPLQYQIGTSTEAQNPGYVLRFEAKGYAPFISRIIRPDETPVRLDVQLRTSTATTVTVLLPSGEVASGAEVFLVPNGPTQGASPGGFSRRHAQESIALLRTDAHGRFPLEPDARVTRVIIVHPDGYAETSSVLIRAATVNLQVLGRIEGSLTSKGLPAPGRRLEMEINGGGGANPGSRNDPIVFVSDEQGEFTLPQVPAGHHKLVRLAPFKEKNKEGWKVVPLTDIQIGAGETKRVVVDEGVDPP
jgi:hypothetical protein